MKNLTYSINSNKLQSYLSSQTKIDYSPELYKGMEFGRFSTLMACSSIRLNTYSLLHVHTCQYILMCTCITFEEYVCTYFNTRLGSRAAVLQIWKRTYVRFVYSTAYMIILLCIHHNINIKTWLYNCIYNHIITCKLLDRHIYLYMIMYTSDRFLGQLRWNCPQVNATEHLQWLVSIGSGNAWCFQAKSHHLNSSGPIAPRQLVVTKE